MADPEPCLHEAWEMVGPVMRRCADCRHILATVLPPVPDEYDDLVRVAIAIESSLCFDGYMPVYNKEGVCVDSNAARAALKVLRRTHD